MSVSVSTVSWILSDLQPSRLVLETCLPSRDELSTPGRGRLPHALKILTFSLQDFVISSLQIHSFC